MLHLMQIRSDFFSSFFWLWPLCFLFIQTSDSSCSFDHSSCVTCLDFLCIANLFLFFPCDVNFLCNIKMCCVVRWHILPGHNFSQYSSLETLVWFLKWESSVSILVDPKTIMVPSINVIYPTAPCYYTHTRTTIPVLYPICTKCVWVWSATASFFSSSSLIANSEVVSLFFRSGSILYLHCLWLHFMRMAY